MKGNKMETQILLTTGARIQEIETFEALLKNNYTSYRVHLGKRNRNNFKIFSNIREASKKTGIKADIYLDIPSDRLRVKKIIGSEEAFLEIEKGDFFKIVLNDVTEVCDVIGIQIGNIGKYFKNIALQDRVLFKDGSYVSTVVEKSDSYLLMRAETKIRFSEMINCLCPDSGLKHLLLDEDTEKFLDKLSQNDLCPDYFILSFVNDRIEIINAKRKIEKIFRSQKVRIVSKIETELAVKNLQSMIQVSDQVMIGRGDLAPQIGFEKMAKYQEDILELSQKENIPCIVATQFLEELAQHDHICAPELNDIFNAIQKNAFAIMLAGEGAASIHSRKCIELLKKIIMFEREKGGKVKMEKSNKKTKIMATAGPTLQKVEEFERAIQMGVSEYRIHMGLRSRDFCSYFYNVREASNNIGKSVEVLLDLPSSRPRVGKMAERNLLVGEKETIFDSKIEDGRKEGIPLPGLRELMPYVSENDRILFRDGRIGFRVVKVEKESLDVECCFSDVPMKEGSSCNFPDSPVQYQSIEECDIQFFEKMQLMGLKPDWVSISFSTRCDQIEEVKESLSKIWPNVNIKIMCKIENMEGVKNVSKLLEYADGIMVGRGDLLVNMDPITLPRVQLDLVCKAKEKKKKVVVATEFFERFALTGFVNRAELSDVALAFREGSDSIMLAMETGNSQYNFECIELIQKIVDFEYENQGKMLI